MDDKDEQTPGYQIGEKKSVEEYKKMDEDDESLQRYKAALGLDSNSLKNKGDPNDKRLVIITEMRIKFHPDTKTQDVIRSFAQKGSEQKLKDDPFTLKENTKYRIVVKFKCQHEIITGLKLQNMVFKKGIRVHKESIMLGSYPPSATDIREVVIPKNDWEEAPGGMLGRGNYKGKHKFIDDDGNVHLEYEYALNIVKK